MRGFYLALTEDLARTTSGNRNRSFEAVAELDFIKAKVEFARSFKAIVPKISDDETLEFIEARHPLLEENLRQSSIVNRPSQEKTEGQKSADEDKPKKSFPLVSINKTKFRDDNFGRKCGRQNRRDENRRFVGLMAISGLPVPAKDAQIPFYKSVLADIGDHQSLSANLSTFSSHISNIAGMMRECSAPSLVLLDEVGTGTDPDEGSALGVAIVDYFRKNCGAQVIASTHYRGLKIYAANDENVINASVEFDEKTLQPTYKLLVGLAGASSGIEIARRFGIRDDVIEIARKNLDISAQEAENYLHKLSNETRIAKICALRSKKNAKRPRKIRRARHRSAQKRKRTPKAI